MSQEVTSQDSSLQSDKMRTKSIGKLLLEMSLPAIISMLVQSLYNIVDSLFVIKMQNSIFAKDYIGTNLGFDSFTAVSIAMPMTMFVIAIAIGIGVGANAYIARKLGEGKQEKANQAAKTALIIAVGAWVVLCVLAFTVSKPFIAAFVNENNVTDVNYVVREGSLYLTIYMAGSLGSLVEITCSRILQATGNMKVPMASQLIGAISNIVLDALFILVFKWGVLGAIVATVIGQWLACGFVLCMFFFKKQDVSLDLRNYKPKKEYFSKIAKIGLPAFVMNAMSSVVTIIMNAMLSNYAYGISILSAYFKVQSFVFMPVFGLMQGTMPILSYNYGANDRGRFNKTFKLALLTTLAVMTVGTLLFQLCPEALMSIFKSKAIPEGGTQAELDAINAQFVKEGAYAFRIISIAFIPAAFSIVIINMLQSVNCPVSSLLMSLSRQLLFLIPVAILFNYLWQQKGIWFCYPIAEVLSVLVYLPFAIRDYKRRFAYKQAQYDQLAAEQAQAEAQEVGDAEPVSECNA